VTRLAQFNIARARWPLEDPRMADFENNLERMNALARRSDGYVWQLDGGTLGEGGNVIYGDPQMTWTLSVWESAEALANFAFRTLHRKFFQRRADWFPVLSDAHLVMWEIPGNHRPDLTEAMARKATLDAKGPTDQAFGWERFPHLATLRHQMAHPAEQTA
jgi:hypothetical protein